MFIHVNLCGFEVEFRFNIAIPVFLRRYLKDKLCTRAEHADATRAESEDGVECGVEHADVYVPTHIQAREEAFDTRIARLKELVAFETANPEKRDNEDDETNGTVLHPGVYNLPHESIKRVPRVLLDVEHAE